jgi:hypothetical protein
MKKLHQVIS